VATAAALLLGLPLALGGNRDWIWPWFAGAAFALLAVALGGAALGRWGFGGLPRQRVFLALACALLATGLPHLGPVGWLGGLAPVDPSASARALLWQGACVALAILLLWGCDSRRRLHAVALALFAGAVLQAVWGAAALLGGFEPGWFAPRPGASGVAHGTFVNRNHFAGHLAMLGALGAGLLLARLSTARPADWRESLRGALRALLGAGTWLRVGLALVVVGLVLSHSRMGNLAFAFALAAGAVFALVAWRPLPRAMPWLFASVVLVDLLLLGSWFGVERVAQRIGETTLEVAPGRDSDAERLVVSRATLMLWSDHPWLGVGPGGFRTAFPSYKPASVALFYDHAHNDWAQALAERGVLGTAPLVALFVLAILAGAASVRARRDPRLRGIGLGAALGLVAFALHGFADFNAQIPANAAAAWALLALAFAARHQPRVP
jgi:hypothetical protein